MVYNTLLAPKSFLIWRFILGCKSSSSCDSIPLTHTIIINVSLSRIFGLSIDYSCNQYGVYMISCYIDISLCYFHSTVIPTYSFHHSNANIVGSFFVMVYGSSLRCDYVIFVSASYITFSIVLYPYDEIFFYWFMGHYMQ